MIKYINNGTLVMVSHWSGKSVNIPGSFNPVYKWNKFEPGLTVLGFVHTNYQEFQDMIKDNKIIKLFKFPSQ